MGEDVDAGNVHRAEGRAAGPAHGRSGDRVHFFDGVATAGDGLERAHDAVERDVIADEVRRVLRDDDALAQVVIGERADLLDDGGIGVSRRDDLEQPEVARRVEEVRAEPVLAEVVAAALRRARRSGCRRCSS